MQWTTSALARKVRLRKDLFALANVKMTKSLTKMVTAIHVVTIKSFQTEFVSVHLDSLSANVGFVSLIVHLGSSPSKDLVQSALSIQSSIQPSMDAPALLDFIWIPMEFARN